MSRNTWEKMNGYPSRIGTARRDEYGNLRPGEYNGQGMPMGSGGGLKTGGLSGGSGKTSEDEWRKNFPNSAPRDVKQDGGVTSVNTVYRPEAPTINAFRGNAGGDGKIPMPGGKSELSGQVPAVAAAPTAGGPVSQPAAAPASRSWVGTTATAPRGLNTTGNTTGTPISRFMPADPKKTPFAVPAPLTGPQGDKGSDAANLAANRAMYAPGGATAFAKTAPQPRADGYTAPTIAGAGTGAKLKTPFGMVSSSQGAPNSGVGKAIVAKYPEVGKAGTPENTAFVRAYKTAGGNPGNALQMADGLAQVQGIKDNRMLAQKAPAAGRSGSAPAIPAAPAPSNNVFRPATAPVAAAPAARPGYSPTESPTTAFNRQQAAKAAPRAEAAAATSRARAKAEAMAETLWAQQKGSMPTAFDVKPVKKARPAGTVMRKDKEQTDRWN